MSAAHGSSGAHMSLLFRKKMRVLIDGAPIGAWVTMEPGSVTVDPDTVGVYKAVHTGVIVQHEPGLVLIRRKLLPALFHSHLLVVRGSTTAGRKITVGVEMSTGEWRLAESILAAGFAFTTIDTKYSAASELGRLAL
jgi:hypothetical protein